MRRRTFRRASGPKRKMTWEWGGLYGRLNLTENDIVASWVRVPAGYVDTANSAGIPIQIEPDATLIRSRVITTIFASNGGAQQDYPWTFSWGLIAWDGTSDDPADIGDLPHPFYDQELDWIWRNDFAAVVENVFTNPGGDLDSYQSKAMRKLSNGTGLLLLGAIADPIGAQSEQFIDFNANFRGLFKLP